MAEPALEAYLARIRCRELDHIPPPPATGQSACNRCLGWSRRRAAEVRRLLETRVELPVLPLRIAAWAWYHSRHGDLKVTDTDGVLLHCQGCGNERWRPV